MKLAVGLFGIHYTEKYKFWMSGMASTDYNDSVENNISFFNNYKIFPDKNEITYFSSTYFSSKLIELIDDYNFKSLRLSHIDNSKDGGYDGLNNLGNNWKQKNRRIKEVIKLILEDDVEYDVVILTRFDILLKEKIYEFELNFDKVNVLYDGEWEGNSMIDDNFYVLSYTKLKEFYDDICSIDENICSHYYHHHIDKNKFNILSHDIVIVYDDTTRDILYNLTRKRLSHW